MFKKPRFYPAPRQGLFRRFSTDTKRTEFTDATIPANAEPFIDHQQVWLLQHSLKIAGVSGTHAWVASRILRWGTKEDSRAERAKKKFVPLLFQMWGTSLNTVTRRNRYKLIWNDNRSTNKYANQISNLDISRFLTVWRRSWHFSTTGTDISTN